VRKYGTAGQDTDDSIIRRMRDLHAGEVRQEYGHSKYVIVIVS